MQKYTQIRKISRGTRGECSLVLNAEDQQLYVAKEVHLDSLSEVERMAALNEVDIMATLDHPNIIKYVESFVQKKCGTPTKLCIVMEYAEGGDLGKCAKAADGEELSEEDILDRFIEICFAVDYCHQQNIMHRDLKLENVFLTSSGHIKLGDFGMSHDLDGPTEMTEDLVGTPYYFSPEIINGLPCGTKSDMWSLGVLLYKLMAHRYPFKGRGLPELLVRIAKGRYEALPDHFSAELRGLVDSLLTADCDARLSASDILRLPLIQRRLGRWEETAASDDGYVRRLKDTHGPSVWQATSKKRPSTAPSRRSVTEELVKIVVSHATEESGPSELDALRPFSWPPRTVSPDDVVSSRSPSAVGLTPKIMLWDGGSSYDRVLAPTATAGDSLLQTCTGKKKQLPALKSPSEPAACPHQPALAKLHSLSAASTAVHTHSTGSGTFSEVTNVGCPKYGEQLAPIDHPGLQSLHELPACPISPPAWSPRVSPFARQGSSGSSNSSSTRSGAGPRDHSFGGDSSSTSVGSSSSGFIVRCLPSVPEIKWHEDPLALLVSSITKASSRPLVPSPPHALQAPKPRHLRRLSSAASAATSL